MEKKRCNFSFGSKEYHVSEKALEYHDTRWCKPEHRDRELFAMLVLEGMQAGVSWNLILNKEDNFRKAFDGFDPEIVANYDDAKLEELMQDSGIIRNRQKLKAAIANAKAFLQVQEEFGSFDTYIWGFTGGKVIDHHLTDGKDMPAKDGTCHYLFLPAGNRGHK